MNIRFTSSLGCIASLMLFQTLFVTAKNRNGVRGLRANEILLDGLPQRLLKNNDKNRDKNRDKNKDKNKNKEKRIEIEKASLDSADDEERSGRDDIGSPVGSTGSQLLPQNSEDTEVESQTGKPRESDQLQSPTVAGSHDGNNIFGSDPGPSVGTAGRNDFLDFEFDSEKYVTGLKMPPISFNMTVSELTSTIDTDELKPHFKAFFEDILGMRSNEDWYPLHSKSMHNISLKLFPRTVDTYEDFLKESVEPSSQVRLVVNGFVYVHMKNKDTGVVTSMTRSAGIISQQNESVVESAPQSTFYNSFEHSLLLYFTFWGTDGLQQLLEESGFQKPIVESVTVGKKELLSFGVDKDANYLYKGDHDVAKPKRTQGKETSDTENMASTGVSLKCSWLIFITAIIAVTGSYSTLGIIL